MKKILLILLVVFSRLSFSCNGSDIAEFTVKIEATSAVVQDLGWRNHLAMLRVMNLIPESVSVAVPRNALHGGVYATEQEFLAVIANQAQNPVANLTLRLMAYWMNELGNDLARPDLSGKFFAWILNQPALEPSSTEETQYVVRSHAHLFKSFSFYLFPSLRELQFFEDQGLGVQASLKRLLTTLHSLEWMASEQLTALQVTGSALNHGINGMGVVWVRNQKDMVWGSDWQTQFGWAEDLVNGHRLSFTSRGNREAKGFWWIPSPGGNVLKDAKVPSIGDVRMDGEELASLIALSDDFVNRQRRDCRWIEYMLFPLLREMGAIARDERLESRLVAQNVRPYRTREIPEIYLKEAAIAYGMLAIYGRDRGNLGTRVLEYLKEVLSTDEAQNFSTIEAALRRFEIPVFLISSDLNRPGKVPMWPKFAQFESRPQPPKRWLMVMAPAQLAEVAAVFRQLRMQPMANLALLEQDTGFLVPFDGTRN